MERFVNQQNVALFINLLHTEDISPEAQHAQGSFALRGKKFGSRAEKL
jgi:hypothetical protein